MDVRFDYFSEMISRNNHNPKVFLTVTDSVISGSSTDDAAWLISGTERQHRLFVRFQIDFKMILLSFKDLYSLPTQYICDLLTWYVPSRSLRFVDGALVVSPRSWFMTKVRLIGLLLSEPLHYGTLPPEFTYTKSLASFEFHLTTFVFVKAFRNVCYMFYSYTNYSNYLILFVLLSLFLLCLCPWPFIISSALAFMYLFCSALCNVKVL